MLSKAKVRGYGGAMGGGKSRTGCEAVFDAALDHPGLVALIARQAHTSIVETTKKTMMNQVIDPRLVTRSRSSGGEDYVELWNGSRIHFVGLDDPIRWYSSEIGFAFFDEAQEIDEDTVLRIMTRLRQRCADCTWANQNSCSHIPNKAILTFNPSNPGHFLQRWFIQGAERTALGFRKEELWMEGGLHPIGDAEFFFAKATDNPYLPPGYVDATLAGMKEWMRRRYLEGLWEFISGNAFFDVDALQHYELMAREAVPLLNGTTSGSIQEDMDYRTKVRKEKPESPLRILGGTGPLTVWKGPVRLHTDREGEEHPAHRYVVAIDSSSGRGADYSAIQVIDVDSFEQVAEWQGKMETGLVAEEAYRIGRLYNNAMIVTELTGGWGLAVEQVLKRYRYPRLYTRRVIDRLSQKWTDRTGFDTSVRTRNLVLESLETALRERELRIYSLRLVNELGTFVYSERDRPEAQPGCNDDLVLAMAIGVHVATTMPREMRRKVEKQYVPTLAAAGW
jgi:hypothetical protein